MKKSLLLLLLCSSLYASFGQGVRKYNIGNSGCAAYFFCDPGTFEETYSQDSAMVYTGECKQDEVNYGTICVKLTSAIADITVAEDLLISYMDYLKTNFGITSAAGYGKGHRLKNREDIHGVIDYWQDGNKNNWKVKGWTDGKFILVMYAYSAKELPETKVNLFLDGALMAGM